MATQLTFGKAASCTLDSAEITYLRPQQDAPLSTSDIAAKLRSALKEPINFPALSRATIPGDHVAVVIEQGMPQQLHVLEGALAALRDAGVESNLITIVLPAGTVNVEQTEAKLADLGHSDIRCKVHDPDDEQANAFLGVTRAGGALRLNRELCEAELVLSLAVTKGDVQPSQEFTGYEGLYPAYSDSETISRLSAQAGEQPQEADAIVSSEVKECGWMLGVGLVVEVVPGPDGQVAALFAGEPASVVKASQAEYQRIWSANSPSRADLVIATLPGDSGEQTWENVSRAILAAEAVLEPGGTIAVCSELAEPPGRSLSYLASNEDPLVIQREILADPSADSGPALRLSRALERGAIYLRSRLHSPVVESLGMTPLESDNELERLAQVHRPCLVLEEAQRLLPVIVEADES